MKIAIAIKYVGQHSQAKDYRLPQHDWEFGETKIVNNEEGNELLKNPDFIIADEVVLKKFNKKEYTCANFVCDAWKELTGLEIKNKFGSFLKPDGKINFKVRKNFQRLEKAISPCIVLMLDKKRSPHVGIFYKNKVIHIKETHVEYQPLDIVSRGFEQVRFYI